ncbi:PDDEXK nuclease domain-containing protein [Microbacterium elymi]|uniref:PDDEXK nuclease domain-containing protein n=1 Tax=Microbacterium elymi TaxID=2909587 RepID=A0ABY5NGR6_9MICO|nr:PDDEXK nuclease domain-containing protein [Microbacterium elymi]UUT34343.1 PDDEXK nuclease domain-containing protein [Microbacterium elymi]
MQTTSTPADAGQLGFYVAVVDDRLRIHDKHQPTVGILLVAGKNDTVVRYALASTTQAGGREPVRDRRGRAESSSPRSSPDAQCGAS